VSVYLNTRWSDEHQRDRTRVFLTGELRRAGTGIPRLRLGEERLWGFECWWRLDPQRGGLTETDRTELEDSKRLLRGLMRDARRSQRIPR